MSLTLVALLLIDLNNNNNNNHHHHHHHIYIYIATLDVSSLYTNIDIDEGLTTVEEELEKANQSRPTSKTLSCLLERVLKLNNFTFNGEHYIQIKGTASLHGET